LGSSLLAIVLVSITAGLFLLLLGQPVAVAQPGWFAVGLVAVLVSGAAVGLLIGSVFVLTRHGPQVSSALMYPVFLLGGMLIPIDFVPAGLRWLAYGISLRWLQLFLTGAATGSLEPMALVVAVGLTAAYGLIGALLFQRMLTRARREATLDLF
jgi:ABC-2 type transport system permease protein